MDLGLLPCLFGIFSYDINSFGPVHMEALILIETPPTIGPQNLLKCACKLPRTPEFIRKIRKRTDWWVLTLTVLPYNVLI